MANGFATAEAQWLSQLAEMRKTISEMKFEQPPPGIAYGEDLDPGPDSGPDDIFDLVDEEVETLYSSDEADGLSNGPAKDLADSGYGLSWLLAKCEQVASSTGGLDSNDLRDQITALLASDTPDDELQMSLIDIVGYDDLDFVAELLSHRREILAFREPKIQSSKGIFDGLQSRQEREKALQRQDYEHKHKALAPAVVRDQTEYPHVYKQKEAGNLLAPGGRKYKLPAGSVHDQHPKYEEMTVPAAKVGSLAAGQRLVPISEMDGLCRSTFKGYKNLNRMQSLVYPVAYKTSENMLICAPTGAGKTDAAMLTILNTVAHNVIPNPFEAHDATEFALEADDFKIVYVAPMKALAAEVTEKLGKRLAWLGIKCREYTGDMQLTKKEVMQTQIIVTTPEKWDVITRKSTGDTELVQKVRLLIIDEVHMLHDERGAVLESLVARTQRQVESTQSLIRIVGLSATLPNYIDVSDFLKVNRYAGLFYFDQTFRPVPLEQHFIGVRGKPKKQKELKENLEGESGHSHINVVQQDDTNGDGKGKAKSSRNSVDKISRENIDRVAWEKAKEMLERGHQIMIFVHTRKDTVISARNLIKTAREEQWSDLLDCATVDGHDAAMRDVKSAKVRELKELLPAGVGIHHAGMPRTDRNKVEQMFSRGHIGVLCCTATLAWGVNLPAAAVIIKGTQLYSADAGKFVDLGILDVLQIFGRAGRPQFQATGIGFIITTQDKFDHYLNAVTQQLPIESRFSKKLIDNLNAEISLGTVTSVPEAVQWLGYSYMFTRMLRAPFAYGIDWSEIRDDPQLVQRRRKLVIEAARSLVRCQMIIFNEMTEELRAKDVGRIASQFYIQHNTIEIFNTMMKPKATEADVLNMISQSAEFDQIQSRENEAQELKDFRANKGICPCAVPGDISQNFTKTNILLQAHISKASVMDFALVSDSAYVAQNAARICRALFMIALNRGWGFQCLVLLSLCQSIDKRTWSTQHPFHQFDLPQPVLKQLDAKPATAAIETMRDMEPAEIGSMVHNHGAGRILTKLLDNFPTLTVEAEIAPLNRDVLRIKLFITPDFRWNDKYHGTAESYWIWVENSETSEIYHHEYFILSRKKLYDEHELNFTIPLSDPLPTQIYVRAVSDRWLGAETVTPVSFQHLIRPDTESVYTDLLNLQPLSIKALNNPLLEEVYAQRFQFFNPMQTQIFHTLYHTNNNVLLGSPTGSGKTVAAELAMWQAFRDSPGSKVVYIAPMKALVRERVQDWGKRLTKPMGLKLVELTGDNTPDTRTIRDADIIITTPEKWDGISRSWQTRGYVRQVSLVIIDEIHLLGGDRGPILEIIVSRMNYIASQSKGKVRLLGMSTACANAMDLGNWLGVKQGLFNFRHSVRPVPLEIFIDGFPEQRGFCPLMQSMNRPTFLAIKTHSPDKPVIVFVASRRQTRLTAKDLINFCGMEDNPRRFVRMSEEDLQLNLDRVKDDALREALSFGIGLHHAGLVESDRQLAEELFANNKIQILVATSTLAWGVNLPAHLVVVKGTQFFDAKIGGYKDMDLTDVLQMLGRAGRPQFDNSGIARIFTQDAKKAYYKHFLHTGFPVESSLHNVLDNHLGAEASAGTILTKQDALDYLTWTFFFRRLHKNPSYYGLEISAEEHNTIAAQQLANEYMVELVDKSLKALADSRCVELHSNGDVDSTHYGKIMSYYYLSHLTVRHITSHATADSSFSDVLAWMCAASEFDELPVRHNEDLINAELAESLPLDIDAMGDLPMWDPHVKAFLLLQAHMSRIDLPISDYVGDQNSVLDQSIRIIQASIDILTELGYLASVKQTITLLQCVKSARWPSDNQWSVLPGVNELQNVKGKVIGIVDGVEASSKSKNAADALVRALNVPPRDHGKFMKALANLPALKINSDNVSALGMEVTLSRQIRHPNPEFRIHAPRYPKPQTEGFFLIATESSSGEVLALKRIGWHTPGHGRSKGGAGSQGQGPRPTARSTIKLEGFEKETLVDLLVMSDSYLGMEWALKGVEIPPVPKVEMDGKKKGTD